MKNTQSFVPISGIDMDGNGYPDVVVGAYDASKTLILLTRPVVQVTAEVQVNNQSYCRQKSTNHSPGVKIFSPQNDFSVLKFTFLSYLYS